MPENKGKSGDPSAGPLTMDQIELALQADLKSDDPKVRHPATRLLLALRKQEGQVNSATVMDPWVMELIMFLDQLQENVHEGTGDTVTELDIIRRMSKVCLTCKRIGARDASLPEYVEEVVDE